MLHNSVKSTIAFSQHKFIHPNKSRPSLCPPPTLFSNAPICTQFIEHGHQGRFLIYFTVSTLLCWDSVLGPHSFYIGSPRSGSAFCQKQCSRSGKFLGFPDPDPLVRGTDPDPSVIKQYFKKNLHFYCFVTSYRLFIFEEWCNCTFKK
jgi:hypothetical protein